MTVVPPSLATVAQLADWIGEPIQSGADTKRAEGVLRIASTLVRNEAKRTWVTDNNTLDTNVPQDAIDICCQAAARAYLNPEGFEQERQDDWYGSRKVKEAGVYLTDSEEMIARSLSEAPGLGGLSTVATTRDDYPLVLDEDEQILPPYY